MRAKTQAVIILGLRVSSAAALIGVAAVMARLWGADFLGAFSVLKVATSMTYMVLSLGIPSAIVYFGAKGDLGDGVFWGTVWTSSIALSVLATVCYVVAASFLADRLMPGMSRGEIFATSACVTLGFIVNFLSAALRSKGRIISSYIATVLVDVGAALPLAVIVALGVEYQAETFQQLLLLLLFPPALALAFLGAVLASTRGFSTSLELRTGAIKSFVVYGARAHVGGLATYLNFRLDILILGFVTTHSQVGVYTAASRFAEVLRMISTSVAYVIKTRIVREPEDVAKRRIARLFLPMLVLGVIITALISAFAAPALTLIYGQEFASAAILVRIIVIGTCLSVTNGLFSSFFDGRGKPEYSSLAVMAGLAITVVGAVVLIVPLGPIGAAITSGLSYTAVSLALVYLYRTRFAGSSSRDVGPERALMRFFP